MQRKTKKYTLEALAQSIAGGFSGFKPHFDKRFDVDRRPLTIEALLASNRIERLEDSVRQMKTLLKIR